MPKSKVLIVDDSDIIQVTHSGILSNVNAKLDVASSGTQALALLTNDEYAVILMDVQMPGMSGFECVSKIRQNPVTQHIPIIFISSADDERQFVDKGYHLGAVDYLVKPIDPDRLISKVNVFITLFEQRVALEESLIEAKAIQNKNDQLLNYMAEGILGLDNNNVINFANIAACTLLTSHREQVVGRPIKDFINPTASQTSWDKSEFNSIFKDGQCNHKEDALFWRNKNETFPVEYTQASILQDNEFVGGVVAFQDITERKKDQQKMLNLARYDQLTQLPNRSMYWDFLSKSIAGCERTDNNIAVLFLDLDNFKQVNDSLGHDAGDELLIQVSKTLKHCVREADIVARVGGDEFAILLLNPRDSQVAASVAQKIIQGVSKPFPIFSNDVNARVSIGISIYPDNGHTATQLTKSADTAMYHAKASGRNTYKYFSREMHERIQYDMKITQELNKAISREELSIHFQPQINAHTSHLVGFEALIRWTHPDLGKVGPSRFIPVAETNGLIADIGDWCLLQALKQAKVWNSQMPENKKICMAVNVSSLQFQQHKFAEHIIGLVEQSCLEAKFLELEITETAIMENPKQTICEIHKIREAGIRVSMDDFGTGYSSLAQLKELPIDILKIDKSFIDEINQSKSGNAIVSSIIDLAHSLDISVVAEGVESLPQFDFLQQHNCDIVQGYYFSRPLDRDNSTAFLRRTIH